MNGDPRSRLIEEHMPLVTALAHRYDHRGEQLEDLVQVAALGLIKAVDRFRPERGVALGAFAAPTIVGEIKHHLRDRTWPLSVPRRLRESRAPSEFVAPEMEAEAAGGDDETLSEVEDRALLEPALGALQERERRILQLRFFADLSQVEIAEEEGISQVQVSRILRDALEKLRGSIGAPDPALTRPDGSSTFEDVTKATNGGAQ
ncbi:MAG: sigma-70 family RNA polymerase sigma factor [Gaiellaceae bacterium]